MAHDFVLHLQWKAGETVDLPAIPDPSQGGLVIDVNALAGAEIGTSAIGVVRGHWGFDSFEGPAFQLINAHPAKWAIPAADQEALIVGREDTFHAGSDSVACVNEVRIQNQRGTEIKATWKATTPNEIEIHVPMDGETAGPLNMTIQQFGIPADRVDVRAYTEAARIDAFKINVGDQQGVLIGTRLDQVNSLHLQGFQFAPVKLSRAGQEDQLVLSSTQAVPSTSLVPSGKLIAQIELKDGRVLDSKTTVEPPRPRVALISKNIQAGPKRSPVHLTNQDSLPQDGRVTFF